MFVSKNHTAVITGAASGIGYALAEKVGAAGMTVFISDRDLGALNEAQKRLAAKGVSAVAHQADVSSETDMERFATSVNSSCRTVNLLCNNAGVAGMVAERPSWELDPSTLQKILAINVNGVLNGNRFFVPRMVEKQEEGAVLNTSSLAALVSPDPDFIPYAMSKSAIVTITEAVDAEFQGRQLKLRCSVLLPSYAKTNLWSTLPVPADLSQAKKEKVAVVSHFMNSGLEASDVADAAIAGVQAKKLYIIAAPQFFKDLIKPRFDKILESTM